VFDNCYKFVWLVFINILAEYVIGMRFIYTFYYMFMIPIYYMERLALVIHLMVFSDKYYFC